MVELRDTRKVDRYPSTNCRKVYLHRTLLCDPDKRRRPEGMINHSSVKICGKSTDLGRANLFLSSKAIWHSVLRPTKRNTSSKAIGFTVGWRWSVVSRHARRTLARASDHGCRPSNHRGKGSHSAAGYSADGSQSMGPQGVPADSKGLQQQL